MNHKNKRVDYKLFIFLQITLLLYSSASVLSKMAANFSFLSLPFCGLYFAIVFLLLLYALLWQQLLKKIDLNIAFANKAITVIWGIIFGKIIFQEVITWNMVVGSTIIICGIVMVVMKHE